MGTICTIYTSVDRWTFLEQSLKLKKTNEPLVIARYGTLDDDMTGLSDLEIYMREHIAQKLKTRQFSISKDAAAGRHLVILDQSGQPVEPFLADTIY